MEVLDEPRTLINEGLGELDQLETERLRHSCGQVRADGGPREFGRIGAMNAETMTARRHSGENIGDTETHVIFVELKAGSTEQAKEIGPEL